MIAMVDCNSFYASCEQVFRPDLWGKPVAVLSNNDGCIIAANKEAKALTHIPYFEPAFKIKEALIENQVTCFSSNYTLYGELSQRVMNILGTFAPEVEVYSIDEAFVNLEGMEYTKLYDYGEKMKQRIFQYTGLPVGVGIAPTKVLAKLANRMSKKIPSLHHVHVIDSEKKRRQALEWAQIKDVWGIGKKQTEKLNNVAVFTALDFTELPLAWVRKEMTVVGERIWRELRGKPCLEFATMPKTKQAIGTAKSFGRRISDLGTIEEACAYYVSEVAEVLRAQQSCATYIQLFLETNPFSDYDKQYRNKTIVTLPVPTSDTFTLIAHARKALRSIYREGYRYKKVGVNLMGIIPEHFVQGSLFEQGSKLNNKALIKTFDQLNMKYGKSTVSSAMTGNRMETWELIKRERSPRFTTQWGELLVVGG